MAGVGAAWPWLKRVLVATDRSETADKAVRWAATMVETCQAELILVQVLAPETDDDAEPGLPEATLSQAQEDLTRFAHELAGPRGRARVVVDDDPAAAILDAVNAEQVDAVIVGNLGMRGRKQFLLGNIPNRISHAARCTVVIVNTTDGAVPRPEPDHVEDAGLLRRAAQIARVFARLGLDSRAAASAADRAKRLR